MSFWVHVVHTDFSSSYAYFQVDVELSAIMYVPWMISIVCRKES